MIPPTAPPAPPTPPAGDPDSALARAVWRAWRAITPPETFRAETLEGRIEMWRVGVPYAHGITANRLRDRPAAHPAGGPWSAYMAVHVIDGYQAWAPDVLVAPDRLRGHAGRDDAGIRASSVPLVAEVVAPGRQAAARDRIRKRRAYARAGIPVYVLIDDHDDGGAVTVLTAPDPDRAIYDDEVRVAYGTPVTIPEGPAKGFTIDEAVTGAARGRAG